VETLTADRDGIVTRCDALAIGRAAWRLGAGRATKDDPVSASAGIEVLAKPGDEVRAGDPLLRLHTEDTGRLHAAVGLLTDPEPAVVVSPPGTTYSRLPLIVDIID
jgi:thymidine phosphorylase